jgi:hypothetical protein
MPACINVIGAARNAGLQNIAFSLRRGKEAQHNEGRCGASRPSLVASENGQQIDPARYGFALAAPAMNDRGCPVLTA